MAEVEARGTALEEISSELLEKIAGRLKAMGNPVRLQILHSLEDGEKTVSEILDIVGGRQANLSKHLNVLRTAGLVANRRQGPNVCYRIRDEAVFSICRSVCDSLHHQASHEVERIELGRELLQGRD